MREALGRFWPAGSPFPPMAAWLGSVIQRDQAVQLVAPATRSARSTGVALPDDGDFCDEPFKPCFLTDRLPPMAEAWFESAWTRWIVELLYDQLGSEVCNVRCNAHPAFRNCRFKEVIYQKIYDYHAAEYGWMYIVVCCCNSELAKPPGGIIIIPPDDRILPGEDEGA